MPGQVSHQIVLVAMAALVGCQVGCRDESATTRRGAGDLRGGDSARDSTPDRSAGPAIPVDASDDPAGSGVLPASGAMTGLVKIEPVQVVAAESLAGRVGADAASRIGGFRVARISSSAYRWDRGDSPALTVRALVVEAETVEDAYGLMSCGPDEFALTALGGETRVERRGGLVYHCWKGRTYLRVECEDVTEDGARALSALSESILSGIAAAERPALLTLLPDDADGHGRRWLARSVMSLPGTVRRLEALADAARVDELLGLGNRGWICVASYDVPEGKRANTVWVASYPTSAAAQTAKARYSTYLSDESLANGAMTNLLPAEGRYVVGTWTAEEEAIQYRLPELQERLAAMGRGGPEAVTQADDQ